jgi:hypothetical protein
VNQRVFQRYVLESDPGKAKKFSVAADDLEGEAWLPIASEQREDQKGLDGG